MPLSFYEFIVSAEGIKINDGQSVIKAVIAIIPAE